MHPVNTLIILFLVLLYGTTHVVSIRFLLPRLTTSAKRLALMMLVAQLLLILIALAQQETSGFVRWLWHLDEDGNIPSLLASTQLALVAIVSFLSAWRARGISAWHRLYFLGLAFVFYYLARDEFFGLHERHSGWELPYAALGAVMVAATALAAARSPRRSWRWSSCFLTGLALSAAGGLVIEQYRLPHTCGNIGLLLPQGCVAYIIEEALELCGIWLALVAMLGHFCQLSPRWRRKRGRLLYVLPLLWIIPIPLPALVAASAFRSQNESNALRYESRLTLRIQDITHDDQTVALEFLAMIDSGRDYKDYGYSLHLVDQVSGASLAGIDEFASRSQPRSLAAGRAYMQSLTLRIPPEAPRNRALWMVFTAWRKQGEKFRRQKLNHSHYRLLDQSQVILGEMVIPAPEAASAPAAIATFDKRFSLRAAQFPQSVRAGDLLSIVFSWSSQADSDEDFQQFLHFVHADSGEWRGHDQLPLGERLPTRLWYAGLADSERWEIPLLADLAPGRYDVFTGLYRLRGVERLPAADASGRPYLHDRVPVGSIVVNV